MTFITGEKVPDEVIKIHTALDAFGYLVFKAEEQLTKEEIESLDNLDTDLYDNPKTQSQRLRNVLYKLHEQDNQGIEDFKDFYKHKTEQIIEHYKKQLND